MPSPDGTSLRDSEAFRQAINVAYMQVPGDSPATWTDIADAVETAIEVLALFSSEGFSVLGSPE